MKITRVLAIFVAAAALLSSCGGETAFDVRDNGANTFICDYLYGVEYDDYDFVKSRTVFEKFLPQAAGCSEVRKGDFVGRNLDWYINRQASAVIKMNATEDHYASIGVIGCCPEFLNDFAASGEYGPIYEVLPMFTVDGLNENGVYVGVNVTATGETSYDPSTWETGKWGHGAAFTNPEAEYTYCVTYLVRVILDRAVSAANAKEIIESINWFEPVGFPEEGATQSFHWLICDRQTSIVLDFIDNKPVFTETSNSKRPSYATVMTNFSNALMFKAGTMQTSGAGYERWDILADNYDSAQESFEGMEQLMSNVWYSKSYTIPYDSHNFMITEYASPKYPAYYLYKHYEYTDDEFLVKEMDELRESFKDKSRWHQDDTKFWYTTHTSVYSISRREMRILTHEGLDGQNAYFEASLKGSHFAKPLEMQK